MPPQMVVGKYLLFIAGYSNRPSYSFVVIATVTDLVTVLFLALQVWVVFSYGTSMEIPGDPFWG